MNVSTFYWLPTEYNVKNFNKHAALDLIRFSAGGLSRADLADKMGLTRAAVSLIVTDENTDPAAALTEASDLFQTNVLDQLK